MPFTRRPDTFLVLSGSKPANGTDNTVAGIDSLSGFVSKRSLPRWSLPRLPPPVVVAPVVAAPVVAAPVVAISPAGRAAVGSVATTRCRPRPPFGRPRTL